MADDNAASASRKRLTKSPEPKPTRAVQLAQALLKDERRLRGWHRRNGARLTGAGPLEEMWDTLRELLDRVLGRTRGARGGGAGPGSGQEAGAPGGGQGFGPSGGGQEAAPGGAPLPDSGGRTRATTAEPPYMSSSEMSAFERLGELEATVKNLPILEREAFENEILRLIGEDAEPNKWKTAYDKSPGRMPLVTEYANNAYMRKLRDEGPPDIDPETQALRDRWERPASSRSPSTRGAAFQDPSEERLSDGNAFLAARRREELGHGTEPSAPPSPTLSASDRDVEPLSPGEVSPVLGPVGLALINDPSLPYRPSPRSGATETAATKAVRSDSDGHARPMGRR